MATRAAPTYEVASSLEKVLEHRLVAALTTHLWLSGIKEVEVLRGEVDCHGYDLVIEANGVLRHIQLKAMIKGGKRREVGVNARLAAKPSGCVVWMVYDPRTLELGPFLWFGGNARLPLPPLGQKVGRHSRGNAEGSKLERPGQRRVPRGRFTSLSSIGELGEALFGGRDIIAAASREDQLELLRKHLASRPMPSGDPWLRSVHRGDFASIPASLDWGTAVHFAHLIDGYELVVQSGWGDPFEFSVQALEAALDSGRWSGGPAELWAALFLEYRRWRMAGREPEGQVLGALQQLCQELRDQLVGGG